MSKIKESIARWFGSKATSSTQSQPAVDNEFNHAIDIGQYSVMEGSSRANSISGDDEYLRRLGGNSGDDEDLSGEDSICSWCCCGQ